MKKIIYIANIRLPTEKAHGIQVMKSCEAFADAGINVELWIPGRKTPIKENPFDFYSVRRNFVIKKLNSFDASNFRFQTFFFLLKLIFTKVPKDSLVYTRSVEIAWFMSKRGYKTTYESHLWPENKQVLHIYLLNTVSFIVCNSKGTEAEYLKRGFKNTLSVPNGVDLGMFRAEENTKELRRGLDLPEDRTIIMYTGHLYSWKGVDVVVEAAKEIKDDSRYFFVFVGGTDKDLIRYRKIKENENLYNAVFVGYKEQKEIPKYLACADVLLLPNVPISEESERYTSPIKVFEYMASGKPIVASNMSSILEILNEKNSILVNPSDVTDLIRGINKASGDQAHTKEITHEALKNVQNYTWTKRAEKILQFLNK